MGEMRYSSLGEMLIDCTEGLRPSERLTVSQAAEKYRKLNNPGAYSGDWKNSKVPYMVEPMDVLDSREFEACVFVGGAQLGKTDALLINWVVHGVKCNPMDMMLVQTAQATARDFSIRRIDRLHRHSPDIGALALGGNKDNVFDKHYRNGMMLTLSWPSINELSGRPIPHVALTDYDRMPENIDGEGSPFDLGFKRTTTFGTSKMTLAESSPGFEVSDPRWLPSTPHEAPPCPGILALYNRGDRRRWYWPCPHCGHFFEPSFKLLRWQPLTDLLAAAESTIMVCPHSGCEISHVNKIDMNIAGKWLKEGQRIDKDGNITGVGVRSKFASFWLKGPAAAFISWTKIVYNYLLAEQEYERTGSQEALKSTVNTDQGEPYYPRGTETMRAPEDLKERAVEAPRAQEDENTFRPLVPSDVRFLVAQVDVQHNRWEVQIHGISPGKDGHDIRVIDRFPIIKSKRIDPHTDGAAWVKPGTYLEDWDLLTEQVINREYELEDRSGFMQIKLVVCDSGGKDGVTANAYNYWRKLRTAGLHHRFLLLKGDNAPGAPRVRVDYPDTKRKDGTANARGEIPILFINPNMLKDDLNGRLDRTQPGGGHISWPDWLPDSFFVEMTAERRDPKKGWEKIGTTKRNEAWDLLVYCIATCLHLKVDRIDWSNPPLWAAEWSRNTLVRAGGQEARFTPKKPGTYDAFAKLGSKLG